MTASDSETHAGSHGAAGLGFSLTEEIERVREIVLWNLEQTVPEIRTPLTRLVRARGKLLRPAFVILSAAMGAYDRKRIANIAAAVEMFHMASLIHDDIVDGAPTRRGAPAVHVQSGRKNAVLMGDYLFARSFLMIAEYGSLENQKRISQVVSRICESEILETASRFAIRRGTRRYVRHIAGKTAALFALSCHVGATEGGCSPEVSQCLRRAGYSIGMGFQIIDDILDLTAKSETLGKPTGNDIREGVFTLPVLYALENDTGELEEALASTPYTEQKVSGIMGLIRSFRGIELAREAARRYSRRALQLLAALPSGAPKSELESITRQLLVREF